MFFEKLQNRKNDGFTLVELIVVIAILAILAGVAVPAYSGYVEKANMAADQQLVSDVKNALALQYYSEDGIGGYSAVVLTKTGIANTSGKALEAMKAAFGEDALQTLALKHDWQSAGVATTQVMLNALNGEKLSGAMGNIYGNADNLSFTEEIPQLMEEIRDVATEIAGADAEDSAVIGLVNGAAKITSGWDVSAIQNLWNAQVSYENGKYNYGNSVTIPEGTSDYDEKLAIAGVIRAKNTCLAMYAKDNGFGEYYDALSSFTGASGGVPIDLTHAVTTPEGKQQIAAACGLDLTNSADQQKATEMVSLLGQYYNSTTENGTNVYKNDAAAYYAMMGIVDTMKTEGTVSGESLDEYFNSVSGPASMFQQLVDGSVTMDELNASYGSITAGPNDIIVSISGNGMPSSSIDHLFAN